MTFIRCLGKSNRHYFNNQRGGGGIDTRPNTGKNIVFCAYPGLSPGRSTNQKGTMKTTDGHEAKPNNYYYLENGQSVILNGCATKEDGKPAYLVTPFYEGETMTVNGDGGQHNEITADYEHEGLEMLVFSIFEKAPVEKLDPQYRARLKEIESISVSAGMLKIESKRLEAEIRKTVLTHDKKVKDLLRLEGEIRSAASKLLEITEKAEKKRHELSDLEDSIPAPPSGETIMIGKSDLQRLNKRDFELQCLENGGVDNWEWYSESLKDFNERYPGE